MLPASAITQLSAARSPERIHAISNVVERYRTLHASIVRFVLLLEEARQDVPSVTALAAHPLTELLRRLATSAHATHFSRISELTSAIEGALRADRQRDMIFTSSGGDELDAMQALARNLEAIDTRFVALCVGHVVERHGQRSVA